ncbi:hypothetical protein [Bauldia litoralis]|uniref:hypothetical protein n=1 Tax=Bauldia litoralis TaxID=665467 RepID=UPI003263EE39
MATRRKKRLDKETRQYLKFLKAQDLECFYSEEMGENLAPLLRVPVQVTLAELKGLVHFFEANGIISWIDSRDISTTCGAPIREFKTVRD